MAELARIQIDSLAISGFGFGILVILRVGVTEKIQEGGRGRMRGHTFEQLNGLVRFVAIEQELGELLDCGFVAGIVLQHFSKNLLGLVRFIVQTIQTG